jgi:hypothetical protein
VTRHSTAGEQLTPAGAGHLPPGTSVPVIVTENGNDVTYTATLTPSSDALWSPFLSQVYLSYSPVWVTLSGGGIDISDCVVEAKVSHAHPPVQAGCDGSITVDMALLQSKKAAAVSYLLDHNPVEIRARWRDEGGVPIGALAPLMKGQISGIEGSQSAPNDARLTFTMHGPMGRLREPFAKVTSDALPLDYFFRQTMAALELANSEAAETFFAITRDANGHAINARPLPNVGYWGCDAVGDIINMFLGPHARDAFNGNGDAHRFCPTSQPPFLTSHDMAGSWLALSAATGHSLTAGSLKTQTGALLMPPFDEDALAWCNRFASDESFIFTEIFSSRDSNGYPTGWNVLAYGAREYVLLTSKPHTISSSDAAYFLAQSQSYTTRIDKDYNAIQVWGRPVWAGETPGWPAMFQGEARFLPSHPRSAEKTGLRTLVLETDLPQSQEQAQVVANIALLEPDGEQYVFPVYHLAQGDARVVSGDLFVVEDDGDLGNEGINFRAARVTHQYSKTDLTWKTDVDLETMSNTEIAQATRNALLPQIV